VTEASRKVERAAGLARLAQEIAGRIPGPETWRNCLRGYASAHAANVLRVSGELNAADSLFEEAKRLWSAGADPDAVLDPGRLLDLEASLRRDQRRFDEALTALDAAVQVGRSPERVLINKGFVLEVMGRYEEAIETLAQAEPLVEQYGDLRLSYMLRFNLAVNYCHVGRFHEATRLVGQVRELAADRGDENELVRILWLEGRIMAGLGRSIEARQFLAQARHAFTFRNMAADAALALLEEAVLLLDQGRTTEVKELTEELTWVLESKGIHREALAALRIFQKAAELEEATAEMVRGLLRFLYRARYDQGLRFTL
jgi:tetratricopeptide (TPR) repeat protein